MEAPQLERKLVAILAADVEGYSRKMNADETGTLATLSSHRTITDALIAQHGGRICNTAGDSILAEFSSVFASVHCAVEVQKEVAEANRQLPDARRLWFRIGINVGDVMMKDGDIFGDGVNIAARIEGLAEPGGICVARGVRDHIRRKVPYGFEDLGEQAVKNITQPIRVFRLTLDQSGVLGGEEPLLAIGTPDLSASEQQSIELVFWESVKDSLHGADYEAYLERYPEGNFATLARARLKEIAAAGGDIADPQEREIEVAFWESVRESETVESLKAYLEKYPHGEFKALAEIRLKDLSNPHKQE